MTCPGQVNRIRRITNVCTTCSQVTPVSLKRPRSPYTGRASPRVQFIDTEEYPLDCPCLNGDLFLFDWKRSTKIVNNAGLLIQSDFKYGFDQLSHVADNSFNKYALQQNLYKYILEEYYGKKISSMNLLVLHPNYHTFFMFQFPK